MTRPRLLVVSVLACALALGVVIARSEGARAKTSSATPGASVSTASPPSAKPADAASAASSAASAASGVDAKAELLQGFLVAANATDLYAPEFIFRVSGWSSDWGSRKLLELAPDGKEVKQGDVLARFEFGAEDALRYVNERIQRAQNNENQSRISTSQAVEALEMDQRRKQIDAEMARLNLQRERALSRRQADGLRISHRVAEFDVDAAGQKLASARIARAAEQDHMRRTLASAKEGMERYQFYVGRFQIKAPHDGVVRHAFNARERRKMQKGDNTQAGMKVLSLAQNDSLAVRFFVPEAQAARIAVGTAISVVVPTSAEEVEGVVESVDFFPQEIGFLLENEGLPNGREKAIQVRASLTSASEGLAAGTEVRVKVRS